MWKEAGRDIRGWIIRGDQWLQAKGREAAARYREHERINTEVKYARQVLDDDEALEHMLRAFD